MSPLYDSIMRSLERGSHKLHHSLGDLGLTAPEEVIGAFQHG
jgi:hypothetical protein